jgi:hypothetical protein
MTNQLIEKNEFHCQNCEEELQTAFEFCPYCGQKTNEKLTLSNLFYNTITNYFSFDARFFKSFIPLLFRPGYLANKFISGKRLLYLHPAQLYLFVSVVFFFLLSTIIIRDQVQTVDTKLKQTLNKPIISDSTKAKMTLDSTKIDEILKPIKANQVAIGLDENEMKALDSLINTSAQEGNNNLTFDFDEKKVDSLIAINAPDAQVLKAMGMDDDANQVVRKFYIQMLKFYKQRNGGQILQAIYDTIPISLFILLPIFALILKILFFRRGSYAHHLVFSFYFFSFLFTLFSLILIANYFFDVPDWIDWMLVFSTFFYLFVAIRKFYKKGWFQSFIKTSIATFIYFLFVIPIAIAIIGLIGFMFY